MDRRQKYEDTENELMQQTYNLFPERWAEVYREKLLGKALAGYGAEEEIPVEEADLPVMDEFLARQEQGRLKQWIRAGQLPSDFQLDTQGVRV